MADDSQRGDQAPSMAAVHVVNLWTPHAGPGSNSYGRCAPVHKPVSFATQPEGAAGRETDRNGLERVPLREQGWNYWQWSFGGQQHNVHYITEGQQGSPVVLVHGFGAHAYHWRYTIPALAKKHRVYSICLLGYGWSDKAVVEYSGETWAKQVADFCMEVVGTSEVTLVGNSIGCVACLSAAALLQDTKGLVLLNSAGNLEIEEEVPIMYDEIDLPTSAAQLSLMQKLTQVWARTVTQFIFLSTKYRIKFFLDKVYHNKHFVDDALVRSIFVPACDPAAPSAFLELSQAGKRTKFTMRGLLKMAPSKADAFMQLYPRVSLVPIEGGHCPMDDDPTAVNAQLLKFLEENN